MPVTSQDPKVTNLTPVQVVFQGGGAKLCLLMAVCEVLKRYNGKQINITRVAGSSAGAIAAAMLATDNPMSTWKSELKVIAQRHLPKMKTNKWRGAWRTINGHPYFSAIDLESIFHELFCQNTKLRYVNDLKPAAELYFTDLYSLESRVAPQDEALAKALAKSCRFPFAFVGFGAGNTEVDGGLALNLPVDRLKKDESTNGSVIGISFASTFGNSSKSGLLSFTQQLFSAAIQSAVARSEDIIGKQNVFKIETEIGTFDFEDALSAGLGTHYELVAAQFDTWLQAWLKSFRPITTSDHAPRFVRPSLSNVPMAPAIIREISDRLRSEPCTHAMSVKSFETAVLDDSGRFKGNYKTRGTMTFRLTRPTNVLQFQFQIGRSGSFSGANLGCAAVNCNGDSLRFVTDVQEITAPGDNQRSFRLYLLFEKPLSPDSPDQPFFLDYRYNSVDPYEKLGTRAEAACLIRWQGDADEMIMAVAFPRSKVRPQPKVTDIATWSVAALKEIDFDVEAGEALVASEALAVPQLVESMELDHPIEHYCLVGRRAGKIKPGQGFGFVID